MLKHIWSNCVNSALHASFFTGMYSTLTFRIFLI